MAMDTIILMESGQKANVIGRRIQVCIGNVMMEKIGEMLIKRMFLNC